ncbi:MAG: hypothetical protein HWD61_15185 [Parachlamydiaceae bacterium]|nr:MAG: hypothetical protein HWD61_15185 [Parachlamydiaceae bacterium]
MKSGQSYETTEMRRYTIGDLIGRYIENELSSTKKNYKTLLGQLLWWKNEIGQSLLIHLKEDLICKCRDKLVKSTDRFGRKRSASTTNRYFSALSNVLTLAVREWRLIPYSPMKNIRKLSEPRGRDRLLSRDERVRLLKACQESTCSALLHCIP